MHLLLTDITYLSYFPTLRCLFVNNNNNKIVAPKSLPESLLQGDTKPKYGGKDLITKTLENIV